MDSTINKDAPHINRLMKDLMPRKFSLVGRIWVGFLLAICAVGAYAYYLQLRDGLSVTGMRDYISWGIYISNFVFFVAISLVGSLISAILKLFDFKWRVPVTRIAELIAVAAIAFAGIIIIVDMGRPERFWHLFVYGRIQSPIIWDVIVVTTYLCISVLLLYLPMLPDIALCRDKLTDIPKWQKWMYKTLALGFRYKESQYRIIKRNITILAILIVPVALSIHTVTSWLFATTLRAGWDSTNFGAYFVSGAFVVGAGGVISAMYILRKFYKLEKYLTNDLFDKMAKMLVMLSLVYLYFNVNEYLVPAYKMKKVEGEHLTALFSGHYAPMFWLVQVFGMIVPIIVLLFKKGRTPLASFIVAVMVVVGAWFKRYLIVIPAMAHPYFPITGVPESWAHYSATWQEWSITLASLAGALLVVTYLIRFFPVIPIWEVAEEEEKELTKSLNSHMINPSSLKPTLSQPEIIYP
jgi:Ni/Fe-hydrogenase subunit HybB-like protein